MSDRRSGAGLRAAIDKVVNGDLCTGCGACAAISGAVSMAISQDGFARPVWNEPDWEGTAHERATFMAACPGVSLTRPPVSSPDGRVHPVFGPYREALVGWAADPDIRWRGSSGGVLTALSEWMLRTGESSRVVAARMSTQDPRRTETAILERPADTALVAGSRYAPVGVGEGYDGRAGTAFVGKPCEVSAARRLPSPASAASPRPLLLSFFCAGVPSQKATDYLAAQLLPDGDEAVDVQYRGRGWPGEFTVRGASGAEARASYEESWGAHLGRHVQPRCAICPDGTGADADVAVGDYWQADAHGYPEFSDRPGRSVIITRTQRGADLVRRAGEAGVLVVEPVDLDAVAAVQPLQVRRAAEMPGRLAGRRLAGRPIPRYRGYRLALTAMAEPIRFVRAARGSYARARRLRHSRTSADE